ncbi:MAG: hypothetical protein HKN32_09915 [Flavobacteriales bacterium]|nr:hypothetical protein [Flavobacteriales bacterium]
MSSKSPKILLLIDGIGAAISVIMLGIVLPTFQHQIGLPTIYLYLLASIAGLFTIQSLRAYRQFPFRWARRLQNVALGNLAYSFLTLIIVIWNVKLITGLGIAYFAAELLIILTLTVKEFQLAQRNL